MKSTPLTPVLESMKTEEKMHTPETDALIKSFPAENDMAGLCDCYNTLLDHARKLERQRDELLQELKNIRDAKPETWDDPNDFRGWAQSRARHTLAKIETK